MTLNQENIYWLFSSSAQAISAFIAFLLTGYALVHTIMEGIEQRDDTLTELHHELRCKYYFHIRLLSLVTGLAIILSLLMVFLNGTEIPLKLVLGIVTVILNVAAIVGGILFVLSIIDPDKYQKVAARLAAEEESKSPPTEPRVKDATFFDEFIQLEVWIRSKLFDRNIQPTGPQQQLWSFHKMVNTLYQHELISREIYTDLLEINKYRNLVFHGQVRQVDPRMLERVSQIREQLSTPNWA